MPVDSIRLEGPNVTAAGLVALQLEPILVRERNLFRQAGCKAAFIYSSVFSKYVLDLFKLILVQNIEHNSNRHHKRHKKSERRKVKSISEEHVTW